jgi:putative transcriptional regulator
MAYHPSEELLAAFAAGKFDDHALLAVAAHASHCPACRRFIRTIETIGGVAIENAEPVPMSQGSFEAVLGKIERSAS